jgi:hypothetical protein
MPALIAPSPITAMTALSSPRKSRATEKPRPAEIEVELCAAPKGSNSLSARLVKPDSPPPLSFDGVVEFHREWLRRDPGALARLYGAKIVRTWYLSDSGRWDRAIALAHAPLWLLAIAGLGIWLRRRPGDPALWLVAVTILYFWAVSAAVSGLARYMAPVQGLLGLLAGVALVALAELARRRRPA